MDSLGVGENKQVGRAPQVQHHALVHAPQDQAPAQGDALKGDLGTAAQHSIAQHMAAPTLMAWNR